jgi:DNA-binding CsgD family transcriptional regulator
MAEKLTCREKEILELRVNDYTREEIAKELGVAVSTVKRHLESIHRKLGVNSQGGLVRKAFEHQLVKVSTK